MKPLVAQHTVRYVDANGTISDATILEPISSTTARLEIGKDAHALAAYDEDKKPNTFHFAEEDDSSAGKTARKPKVPFEPGKPKTEAPA